MTYHFLAMKPRPADPGEHVDEHVRRDAVYDQRKEHEEHQRQDDDDARIQNLFARRPDDTPELRAHVLQVLAEAREDARLRGALVRLSHPVSHLFRLRWRPVSVAAVARGRSSCGR